MYKVLTIDGRDYKFEFSVEASLYNECIEKITNIMVEFATSGNMKEMLNGLADLPKTSLNCFYAGLLEHHGAEGDRTVMGISDAKKLAIKLIKSEDSDINNWYDLFRLCVDQMGEDGFFELIGLTDLLSSPETETAPTEEKKTRKRTPKAVSATS